MSDSLYARTLSFDLSAGLWAFSGQDPFDVFIDDKRCFTSTCFARLLLPTDTTVDIFYNLSDPSVRRLQLTDPVDPTPHEGMLSEPRPLTLQEQIARFIRTERMNNAQDEPETFEEADDFDMDDDDDQQIFTTY